MADPRFFENLGPFTLAQICEKAGIAVPPGADADFLLHDLADLNGDKKLDLIGVNGSTFTVYPGGPPPAPLPASSPGPAPSRSQSPGPC